MTIVITSEGILITVSGDATFGAHCYAYVVLKRPEMWKYEEK